MLPKEDEDKINKYIKYMELEKNIVNIVKNSAVEHLEANIGKLGFVKVFESKNRNWFLYKDNRYILVLVDDKLYLYEKGIELIL